MKNFISFIFIFIGSLLIAVAHKINDGSDCFVGFNKDKTVMICGYIILGKRVTYFTKNMTDKFKSYLLGAIS